MKHRKINQKKAFKKNILKLTSSFVIASLVLGGFFIKTPPVLADDTGILLTVDNGAYEAWSGGESDVNDTSPISCSASDSIREDETGDRESFIISLSSIPDGRVITSIDILTRDRGHSSAGGTYKTFARLNGVNIEALDDLTATGDSDDPCSEIKMQTIDVSDTVKSDATTLEIGVLKTSGNTNTVRVGTITAVVTYVDTTAPVITLTGDTPVDVAVGDSYTDLGATASDNVDGDITANIVTVNSVNSAVVGSYTVIYNAVDNAGNAAEPVTRVVNVADTTPPEISLLGSNPYTLLVNTIYSDDGATASDNYDGDITPSIIMEDDVDSGTLGSYTVTYNVNDAAGNAAEPVTRTVEVVDTTLPIINLEGDNPQVIEVGSEYVELGATVTDDYDPIGDCDSEEEDCFPLLEIDIGEVNTGVPGSYTVYYDAIDSSENEAEQVTRTVEVADTTLPVITMNGDSPVTVVVGAEYEDAGATATDNYDGDITLELSIDNSVNTSVVGLYTVTYNVSDSSSNAAEPVTRTVNVVDITAPVVTLIGSSPFIVAVGDTTYEDAGATATDNYDGDITANIVTVNSVNSAVVGPYTVTYNVADAAGNVAAEVIRTVNVVDTLAPMITLNGDNPQTIEVGTVYSELGATVTDNVDSGLVATIDASTVNTASVGSYLVTYSAIDSSGNVAESGARTVDVVASAVPDTTAPVITLLSLSAFQLTTGDSYTDPGATAQDNIDGDLTANIIIVNPVNTATPGTYTISYNVSDAAGNAAEPVTRAVIVSNPVVSGPSGGGGPSLPSTVTPSASPSPSIFSPVIVSNVVSPPVQSVLSEKITKLDELISALQPFRRDSRVKELQAELKKLGFFSPSSFTDFYGPMTMLGVKKYQASKNTLANAAADTTSLLDTLISTLTPFRRDSRVKELQAELKKLGFFLLDHFTDYYGPLTNAGVKRYLTVK